MTKARKAELKTLPIEEFVGLAAQRLRDPEWGHMPKYLTDVLAERELAPVVTGVIPEGQRNHMLTSMGGTMRRRGMSHGAILAALRFENQALCQPPLDDAEVIQIAQSVATYMPAAADGTSSWAPIDMSALLAGDLSPLEPTCMVRSDGQPLLYPGRVHDFHGEPETGKSWAAQLVVAEVLNDGGRALYLDFDGEARDVVGHLRALGVSDERIRDGLLYVRPDDALGDTIPSDLSVPMQAGALGVSVIDGVNNAMATSGLEPNSNLDVRKWWDRLVRPIQLATEGATILIDHVAKNKDGRGDWAVGAGQKKAGIDGASFYFEPIRAFGRGRTGEAKIVLHKDRPGALRGRQGAGKVIAIMRLTSHEGDDHVEAELMPPLYAESTGQPDEKKRLTGYMQRISKWLEKVPAPVSQRAVEAAVTGTAAYKRKALSDLIDDGYVERTAGTGTALLHRSIKPYRDPNQSADSPPADWKPGHDLVSNNEQVGTRVPTAAALRESAKRLAAKVTS